MIYRGVTLLVALMLGMFTCPEVAAFHEVEKYEDEAERGSLGIFNREYFDSLIEKFDDVDDVDEDDIVDPLNLKSSKSSKKKKNKSKSSKSKSSSSTTYYTTGTTTHVRTSGGGGLWVLFLFLGIVGIIIAVVVYRMYCRGHSVTVSETHHHDDKSSSSSHSSKKDDDYEKH